MSRLLALSFDCPTSPTLTLGQIKESQADSIQLHGWGIAWYPNEGYSVAAIKDAHTRSRSMVSEVFSHWKHFNSTIMICHLRGASKSTTQQDTQPFSRTYAGRDWTMTHNGELNKNYKDSFVLDEHPLFEPMGTTDSEYLFCWILSQIEQLKARSFADINYNTLHAWLQEINQLGTANIILSDGNDLIIYQDKNLFNPLYWTRKHPPHKQKVFESHHTCFSIDDEVTAHRTFVLVTTYETLSHECTQLRPGQMLIIRRGTICWDSELESNANQNTQIIEPAAISSKFLKSAQSQSTILTDEEIKHFSITPLTKATNCHIFNISHSTTYRYNKPVEYSKHSFRLYPVQDRYQEILQHELTLSTNFESETFDDVFGNRVSNLIINSPYNELNIKLLTQVCLHEPPTTNYSVLHRRQQIPLGWMPWQRQMMLPYLLPQELPESQLTELTDYAMSFVKRNDYDVFNILCDINETIYKDYDYVSGSTSLDTTPFDVYIDHRGVCQDFANLFICLARLLNIPARYRAGYIYTGVNYENKIQSEASHAWAEVYFPWLGWRGFDPTNGCLTSKDHIRIACGRNYFDATPTSGTIFQGGGCEELQVEVKVELVNEKESG